MIYRPLGRSGLMVSAISFGTMTFGGRGQFGQAGNTDASQARRQLDLCIDAGVNLVDTADVYSNGLSEEIVGAAIAGRRDQLLVATKCGMAAGPGCNERGLSRHHIISSCDRSLKRLGIDHIDIYQVHSWDGQTPLEETLDALDSLVCAGKVRYLGCSNFSAWHLMKALAISAASGRQRFVSQQIYYSLHDREAEYELVPASLDQGVGVLVWSPLAGGLLSGKYHTGEEPPAGSRHLTEWNEPPVRDPDRLRAVVECVVEVAGSHGVSPACVALAWLLQRPAVTSLVVGARNDAQLVDNLAATELALTDEDVARLSAVSALPLLYPYWHQRQTVGDRLGPADLTLLRG